MKTIAMGKLTAPILTLIITLGSPVVNAACIKPDKPNPPLNAKSDKETFQRVYQQTQQYLHAANEHLKCLTEEKSKKSAASQNSDFGDEERMKDYNATADEIRAVSTHMQEQEQKFKAQPIE